MSNQVKPHEYADVIKAWADGATVQFRELSTDARWEDAPTVAQGGTPYFCRGGGEWRVKPIEHKFEIGDLVRVTSNTDGLGTNWCAYPVGAVVRVKGCRFGDPLSYHCEGYDADEGRPIDQFLTENQVASFDI